MCNLINTPHTHTHTQREREREREKCRYSVGTPYLDAEGYKHEDDDAQGRARDGFDVSLQVCTHGIQVDIFVEGPDVPAPFTRGGGGSRGVLRVKTKHDECEIGVFNQCQRFGRNPRS